MISRIIFGIVLMSYPSIMIIQNSGMIEMHFAYFILAATLARYKDLTTLLSATLSAVINHVLFTYLQLNNVQMNGQVIMYFSYVCNWEITQEQKENEVIINSTLSVITEVKSGVMPRRIEGSTSK